MLLSEDVDSLWHQLANCYADNTGGFMLSPLDCQAILNRLKTFYERSVELEKYIPPEPPAITGDNIVDFQKLRNTTKPQRRI